MFCSVPIWRLIAATDMATGTADAKMQPGIAQFEAFFTPRRTGDNVADSCDMFAKYCHAVRCGTRASPQLSRFQSDCEDGLRDSPRRSGHKLGIDRHDYGFRGMSIDALLARDSSQFKHPQMLASDSRFTRTIFPSGKESAS
jgi:hypothetical protein